MSERRVAVEDRGAWWSATAAPHPALRGFLSAYVGYWEEGLVPRPMRTQPTRHTVLIINLGEPLRMLRLPDSRFDGTSYTSFIAGMNDGPGMYESPARQTGIQLDITPLGAYTLLGVPMHELTNAAVDLVDLLGPRTEGFVTQLAETPDWGERFDLLDELLLSRLDRGPSPAPEVSRAWRLLYGSDGQIPVAELADEVGWSRKHLVERFRDQVGLTPKVMARVLRFHRAMDLMMHGMPNWVDIALTSGYYDQAHMNREFRVLSGLTPTELLADRHAHYDAAG
ncbi:MAG TPA: AraC family transcriptional regulator [Streptosporangiaceae bacterium]